MAEDLKPLDLFGNPVREGHGKPGRPAHVPDEKSVNRVKLGILMGKTEDEIALSLGINAKTLRKHYSRLFKGRLAEAAMAEAGIIERLIELGMAGNASMMKIGLERIEREQIRRWGPTKTKDDEPDNDPGPAIGKKARADKAAADSSFSDWLDEKPN